jgi:hypothetical protein
MYTRTLKVIFFSHLVSVGLLFYLSNFIGLNILKITFNQVGTFDDFENLLKIEPSSFAEGNTFGVTPFLVDLYRQINILPTNLSIWLYSILNVLLILIILYRFLKVKFLVLLILTSWPFIFLISRGNNDIWVFCILILLSFNLINSKTLNSILAGLLISIDPIICIVFLILFIIFNKIQAKYVLLTIVFLNAPLLIRKDLLTLENLTSFITQLIGFWNKMVVQGNGSLFSNSFDYFIKAFSNLIKINPDNLSIMVLLAIIIVLSMTFLSLLSVKLRDPYFKYIYFGIFITSYLLIFSPSPDYKLIFLAIPMLGNLSIQRPINNFRFEFLLIISIWLPKHFIYFGASDIFSGYTISSLINPILLLILLTYYLRRIKYSHIYLTNKVKSDF